MNDLATLTATYDRWTVFASLLIATLASYVALDLAKRVRTVDRGAARAWWVGGSLVLGTGIWSMHFVGMLAFSLPITLGYTKALTALSWVAAVAVSALALGLASRRTLRSTDRVGGSLAMGGGICAMHYLGMAAIDLAPGIVWDLRLVAASALIAIGASGAALSIFVALRRLAERPQRLYQLAAALVMGCAIGGMHYTGMAAASFPDGAVCASAGSLASDHLGPLVALASLTLLAMTLATSLIDARLEGRTHRLAGSLKLANAQLQAANAELQQRALLDPLTGLANRLLFEDRLAHAVARIGPGDVERAARAAIPAASLAVLFVDLDGFKPVNDSLGHTAGDQVLKEAAARLLATARGPDTVARVGGDEFLLLIEDVDGPADAVRLARRVAAAIAKPFEIADRRVQVSASIGIAIHPGPADPAKLIANADAAMYAAKRAGGNTYALFESHMDAGALAQLTLLNDLRHAAQRGQLQLHYQPKVDAARRRISGVEALLRWRHPVRGMVGPDEFIPVAERFGIIHAIGRWVIDEACRQIQAWARDGVHMRVAINLSVHQLREDDLVPRIRRALERHRIEPSQLLCEITESAAMEDVKATQRAFDGLARIGVFLSIDDFGTGYSSLSTLRQLPARQLKIDRSFIRDLEPGNDACAIVDAVVKLAHALGLRVVAEGVETEAQCEILQRLGCDELQGYFFARPMPAAAVLAWARGDKPAGAVDFAPSVLCEAEPA